VKHLHMRRRAVAPVRLFIAIALVWLSVGAQRSHAQSTKISGSVQDTQKAQISGAKITITRTETNQRREALSNNDGNYALPAVLPGRYEVKVEKEGFGTQIKSGVEVLTDKITVVDFDLKLGSVQQQVEVDEAGALLQTESSTISSVIENETILNLPLLDRRASQLQRLNGFVTSAGTGSGTTFAIAGGRGNNATYYIDGGT
jgi:hypothetical protein